MQKRGRILRDPISGPGLLMVDGQQYPFSLEGVWKSEVPPASGMVVDVNFDPSHCEVRRAKSGRQRSVDCLLVLSHVRFVQVAIGIDGLHVVAGAWLSKRQERFRNYDERRAGSTKRGNLRLLRRGRDCRTLHQVFLERHARGVGWNSAAGIPDLRGTRSS